MDATEENGDDYPVQADDEAVSHGGNSRKRNRTIPTVKRARMSGIWPFRTFQSKSWEENRSEKRCFLNTATREEQSV